VTSSYFIYDADNEAGTAALGRALVKVLPPRTTVALNGTLGAGKTRLVQAIAAGAGIDRRDAVSPTFVLCQEYHGERTIYHLDAYRLKSEDEFLALGVDEYFEYGDLVLIEWADRVARCLPDQYVEIAIDVTGEESRRFTVSGHGERLAQVGEQLKAALKAS